MTAKRILYLDPFSGVSGDMFVGALLDLGADLSRVHHELTRLKLSGYQLSSKKVMRGALSAVKFNVEVENAAEHSHGSAKHSHSHSHSEEGADHTHTRAFADIKALIENSTLSARVKVDGLKTFQRLAEAEGRIHNIAPEAVNFHEVGALDSIADVLGGCIALELLGVEELWCGPLALGKGGFIQSEHGLLPVPAPATLELMRGIPMRETPVEKELTTPTGAALIAALVVRFGPLPPMTIEKIGYGAGAREEQSIPNVLRAVLGTVSAPQTQPDDASSDTVLEIQANLDNATPEVLGYLSEKLFESGALDVFFTPIQMKKSRPGTQLTVLAEPATLDQLAASIFAEAPTFGLRHQMHSRLKLARRTASVDTPFGSVRVKIGEWQGKEVSVHPEYEDCRKLAKEKHVPLRKVIDAARTEFLKRNQP